MEYQKIGLPVKGNFIDGEFRAPSRRDGEWISRSPGDFSDELGVFSYSYADVDRAVESARAAFKTWRDASQQERNDILKKYQAILKRREAEIVQIIAREVGKPLWESKTELTAMVNKVDVTINESLRYVSDIELEKIMENTNGVCRYRPLGVMAVIGPFNFPGHLPNGHIVPALLTGNTVVFKPSEKAPLVGQLIAECLSEAGLPKGVFNLVQGEKEVGRRLCVHEGVNGVLFTGSYEVGTRIKQDTLLQHWKLLALEMGGKNPAIVCEDADLDLAVHDTLVGAFITAGQRCSATSRILVDQNLYDRFVERYVERARALTIGHPLQDVFMGPVVEAAAIDRYLKAIGTASKEGYEIALRGKALDLPFKGNYVSPTVALATDSSVEAAARSSFQQNEIFAPCVAIIPTRNLDHALALANATQYGLVASVFTQDRGIYEKCWRQLEFGLINWNKQTVGASSRLPFGGLKKSGNHFPTALTSTLYCTYPVASLETSHPKAPTGAGYPGLNWSS